MGEGSCCLCSDSGWFDFGDGWSRALAGLFVSGFSFDLGVWFVVLVSIKVGGRRGVVEVLLVCSVRDCCPWLVFEWGLEPDLVRECGDWFCGVLAERSIGFGAHEMFGVGVESV
ncbi:hypothetical protein Droror1_Dr00020981 [Drosera rotundifolia]